MIMNDRLETGLKKFWVLVSFVSLGIPYALNQFGIAGEDFAKTTEITIIALFVLTLPSSLFTLPLLAGFKYILEINTGEMFGAYLYIILLNIIGYVQWFRLMPVFFGKSKPLKFASILEE